MEKASIIVYNFSFFESIGSYLPSAFIAEVKEGGTLGYMQARAILDTVLTYVDISCDPVAKELLTIVTELSVDNLEHKFAKKGRKRFSLSQLYEDEKGGHVIRQFLARKMNRFLDLLVLHRLPLCLELDRKIPLETIRIRYGKEPLKPQLFFHKTQTGIKYKMQLASAQKYLTPKDHDTHIITNDPAYIVIDYCLYPLANVNGNKLKPFLKKEDIFIPQRITKTYFRKFIMDVASKVDIHAEGFTVAKTNTLQKAALRVTDDFMSGRQLLDVLFDYGETTFFASEQAKRRTRLMIEKDEEVTIKQIERSPDEKRFLLFFAKNGLKETPAKRWMLEELSRNALFSWLTMHNQELKAHGFAVEETIWKDKRLRIEKPSISLVTESKEDWFDIKGKITIGDYQLSFSDLLDHIKDDNSNYLLPDGSYFIIPEAWMEKYAGLARFKEDRGDHIRILKSNYTLLEEGSEEEGIQEYVVTKQDFDYQPSPHLKAELRPYQLEGVKWLLTHQKNELGACLADDMGLGKTIQTLAVLNYTKDQLERKTEKANNQGQLTLFASVRVEELNPLRALIILPASLVFNWYEEIKKFSPRFHVCQYIGPKRKNFGKELDKFDIVLTTYHTAARDIDILQKTTWEYIILDESQMIKNRDSKLFQTINTLETNHKISLSGTPIENSLADLWSQMQFINPEMLGSFTFFKKNFITPIKRDNDEAALELLRSMVSPFILRRRKEEVARDLPALTQMIEYIQMSKEQGDLFEKEKSKTRNYLLGLDEKSAGYNIHVFQSLLRLRQLANHPRLLDESYTGGSGKYDDVLNRLDTILRAGHKVLMFSSFRGHLRLFEDYFTKENITYSVLTGKSSQEQRQKAVKAFQNDPATLVFLISIKAGGTGLNLTEADYVFILDPWWNPFVEEQAIARAHRIGQENPVTVIRFISQNSIEEKIIKLQARKKVLAAELIESDELISFTKADLADLLS